MVISSNTYPAMRNSKAQQKIYKKKIMISKHTGTEELKKIGN